MKLVVRVSFSCMSVSGCVWVLVCRSEVHHIVLVIGENSTNTAMNSGETQHSVSTLTNVADLVSTLTNGAVDVKKSLKNIKKRVLCELYAHFMPG